MASSTHRPLAVAGALLASGLLVSALAGPGYAAPSHGTTQQGTTQQGTTAPRSGQSLARQLVLGSGARAARTRPAVEDVSLQLSPRDAAGLAALAVTGRSLPAAQRFARLDAVLAGPVRAGQVARILRGLGLTVTSTSAVTVEARGPAGRVDALFGSARGQLPQLATAQSLPTTPAALRGLVTVAWGGDESRPAYLPHAVTAPGAAGPSSAVSPTDGTLSVAQARSLYGVPATTTPPSATAPIVATLQFSTWPTEATDLNAYARDNGLYPSSYDATSGVTTASVADSCGTANDNNNGNVEVALDQETLLTIAPQLRQRMYVAPNCGKTEDEALAQVVSDVRAGQPIVALSTSWGQCELAAEAGNAATADQQAIQSVLAAGVTVFAASGDNGSYDCLDSSGNPIAADAVDAPASVPGVVGVGGTSGTASLTTWNNAYGATGGGFSCGVFVRPTYQAPVAHAAAYPHNGFRCPSGRAERQVPDIAADAGDGLDIVIGGQTDGVLGTSFAAPLSAGGMAQTLLTIGGARSTGLGDITSLLYTRPGLTDVRSGSNGDYAAAVGDDEATGLGSPRWPTLLTGGAGSNLIAAATGADGVVTVRSAVAAARWRTGTSTVTTPLTLSDPSRWRLFFAPYGGDGANDLWGVLLSGASGHLEVHVLSQASGYQTYLAHIATAQPAITDPAAVQVRAGSFDNDRATDLSLVVASGTASGRVEVHVLGAAAHYGSFLGHYATALGSTSGGWSYLIGDRTGSGDLVAVGYGATGSGRVEVHTLTRVSGYRTFASHIATPQPLQPTDGSAQWSLRDLTGDGVPEVVLTLLSGTGSGQTELHALAGPSYQSYADHVATALPSLPDTDVVGLPQ